MSAVRHPLEKKRLAYSRDHYNRNGESNKAWRKTKPLKKAKAQRAFRKKSNDLLATCTSEETAPLASVRKRESARLRKITDWGSVALHDFVKGRKAKRQAMIGARKMRKAKRA
jgi:hypothetical protein